MEISWIECETFWISIREWIASAFVEFPEKKNENDSKYTARIVDGDKLILDTRARAALGCVNYRQLRWKNAIDPFSLASWLLRGRAKSVIYCKNQSIRGNSGMARAEKSLIWIHTF